MIKELSIKTAHRCELIDITSEVQAFVRDTGVETGLIVVYNPHTTAGITINEDADPSVRSDMNGFLQKLIPISSDFAHSEGNSDAHIKSSLVGSSETMIIDHGKLILGRWQGIYFCEFDGPRSRKVVLKIISG